MFSLLHLLEGDEQTGLSYLNGRQLLCTVRCRRFINLISALRGQWGERGRLMDRQMIPSQDLNQGSTTQRIGSSVVCAIILPPKVHKFTKFYQLMTVL